MVVLLHNRYCFTGEGSVGFVALGDTHLILFCEYCIFAYFLFLLACVKEVKEIKVKRVKNLAKLGDGRG